MCYITNGPLVLCVIDIFENFITSFTHIEFFLYKLNEKLCCGKLSVCWQIPLLPNLPSTKNKSVSFTTWKHVYQPCFQCGVAQAHAPEMKPHKQIRSDFLLSSSDNPQLAAQPQQGAEVFMSVSETLFIVFFFRVIQTNRDMVCEYEIFVIKLLHRYHLFTTCYFVVLFKLVKFYYFLPRRVINVSNWDMWVSCASQVSAVPVQKIFGKMYLRWKLIKMWRTQTMKYDETN